jgi:hypothetical protein
MSPIIEGQSKNLNHFETPLSRIKRKSETANGPDGPDPHFAKQRKSSSTPLDCPLILLR